MLCTVCGLPISVDKEDHVILNGSCGHTLHARCWADRWLLNGGSCAVCVPKLTNCSLIVDPLNTGNVVDDGGASVTLLTTLRSRFEAAVEDTKASLLRQGLRINDLRSRGVSADTAQATIEDLIESGYSGEQLEKLGYDWSKLLAAGLTEKNFKRFPSALHFVKKFYQLEDLCSGDKNRAKTLIDEEQLSGLPDKPKDEPAIIPQSDINTIGSHEGAHPLAGRGTFGPVSRPVVGRGGVNLGNLRVPNRVAEL